ncbi:FAD-dependent oxidoreductase [Rhizobacter sp. AJA081-3]|uniref:FAD-dependent oxidoreductase n=1 Tax=Rhizobacter sp. AJA081-3 TaxID=2753607 RepID=UPI001ADEF153|nr:FAD-dependent oxidoreductase [Rhizobacter sp. AJA081-3]QTN25365.1 FAD-dependent oxidoreductase [Rhizobacter sp. AJA081-3]
MRVAVIGAGIVGVTTAYELAADGHEVTVFERRGSVAAEASFANAGVVAPGYVTPWASPGMPMKVLGMMFRRHAAIRVRPGLDPSLPGWLWRWWRACRHDTWLANRTRMQRLAVFSRHRLHELTTRLQLEYERESGYLVLLRSPKELASARAGLKLLTELGGRFHLVDAAQCRTLEPALNPDTALHAGIHLPDDEVGNCRQFAHLLRTEAQDLGARWCFHTVVQGIVPGKTPQVVHRYMPPAESTQLVIDPAPSGGSDPQTEPAPLEPITEEFDAVVVCAAMGSPELLRPHGLKLPLRAVHGYSVTAPLRAEDSMAERAPRAALMDERYKVAISRIGSRVRVAGSAELGGSLDKHDPRALETLYKVLNDWFPGAPRMSQAQRWKGARPMLPDGPPVLGASGLEGIWLNLGHGSSGWALACGSAFALAQTMAGREAPISLEGLGIERLR